MSRSRKSVVIRRLRQGVQVVSLLLFLYLFWRAFSPGLNFRGSDLFYRLDPLTAITAMLAGRVWIPGLALAGLTLAFTLVFGRVWCGWVCPMGTLLEWFSPRRKRGRQLRPGRKAPSERWRVVKYVLLIVILLGAVFGNQTLMFLDPLTILTRTLTAAVWPALRSAVNELEGFLYQFEFLWGPLDVIHDSMVYPLFQDVEAFFVAAVPVFLFFLAIVALNWWVERFWCRYLCPLGGLLGLLSKLSLVRREVGNACASCALCGPECPTGTIDPKNGMRSDPAECVVCYDCMVRCTRDGTAFRLQLPEWKPAAWKDYDPGRREALTGLALAATGAALAGVEPIRKRQPADLIRPPGARLTDFEALCIRCGECVRVCPTQGLQPSLLEGGWQNLMTPRLMPRLGYCSYNCNACIEVCPTGAIPPLSLMEKQSTPIGLARVDQNRCLPWAYNIICTVCEEACPLPEKAIWLEAAEVTNAQGETLILQRPYVVQELCIGCGICEHQCPMGGESAIRVFSPTDTGLFLGGV